MKKLLSVFLGLVIALSFAAALAEENESAVFHCELTYCYDNTESMLEMVNEARTSDPWYWSSDNETKLIAKNLPALKYDYGLERLAMIRAAEIAVYYSHTRPTGMSWYTVGSTNGENIAAGFTSKESVFVGWWEEDCDYSGQGHRRNILGSYYTHIGIGCVKADGTYFWVQEFGMGGTGESRSSLKGPADVEVSLNLLEKTGELHEVFPDPEYLRINEGESAALPAVKARSGWGRTLSTVLNTDAFWTAENTGILSVENGRVTGLTGGKAKLTMNAGTGLTTDLEVSVICREHTWVENAETAGTTSMAPGIRLLACSVCGEILVEQEEVSPSGDGSVFGLAPYNCTWTENSNGTRSCRDPEGRLLTGPWEVNGSLYFFNLQGETVTGWQRINGSQYYFSENGRAARQGRIKIGGNWYFFESDGRMATGWVEDWNTYYYMKPDGSMATGWIQDYGNWFYMDADGRLYIGWLQSDGDWYLLKPDGTMATGWVSDKGNWYYFKASGVMATGWISDGWNWYYLRPTGEMATGWVQSGNDWYLLKTDGTMATGWYKENGSWYYFKPSGVMATGWQSVDGVWYYFRDSGKMATGWFEDKETENKLPAGQKRALWYWFDGNGNMAKGWKEINGQWEMFDESSGEWLYTWQGN